VVSDKTIQPAAEIDGLKFELTGYKVAVVVAGLVAGNHLL